MEKVGKKGKSWKKREKVEKNEKSLKNNDDCAFNVQVQKKKTGSTASNKKSCLCCE